VVGFVVGVGEGFDVFVGGGFTGVVSPGVVPAGATPGPPGVVAELHAMNAKALAASVAGKAN